MRIGVLSDLHIGGSLGNRWHNRQLSGRAEELARASITLLNQQDLDRVVVLGDLTNAGRADELRVVNSVLSSLSMPWFVLPGNHDAPALKSGAFREVFGSHVPDVYCSLDGIGMVFVTRLLPLVGPFGDKDVDSPRIEHATLQQIATDQPRLLLAFSHYPLVSEESHATVNDGAYAGHWAQGYETLLHLGKVTRGKTLVFCGHLHWHHVMRNPKWVQCATGALVEYPMECRVIDVRDELIGVTTLATASPEAAAESLDSAEWVRGQAADRCFNVCLRPT